MNAKQNKHHRLEDQSIIASPIISLGRRRVRFFAERQVKTLQVERLSSSYYREVIRIHEQKSAAKIDRLTRPLDDATPCSVERQFI